MTPERRLWQSVIFQAAVDATNPDPKSEDLLRHKREAASWFRGRGRDFCEVCNRAGMDPDFLHEAFVAGRINRDILKKASRIGGQQ